MEPPEATEKYLCPQKELALNLRLLRTSDLFRQVWWLMVYDLRSRGHRGEGGKKFFNSLKNHDLHQRWRYEKQ
jgi:hypothetical protein